MRFDSPYDGLRLVKKARAKTVVEGQVILSPGEDAQFKNGVYETDDKEMIKWLLGHDGYKRDFFADIPQSELQKEEAGKKGGKKGKESVEVKEENPEGVEVSESEEESTKAPKAGKGRRKGKRKKAKSASGSSGS